MRHLSWNKAFLTSNYELFSENLICGVLKNNNWSQSAIGELNGKKYKFKEKGFFNKTIKITSAESEAIIGDITLNFLQTKAFLRLASGKEFVWSYKNNWHTKWYLQGENVNILYSSKFNKGVIETEEIDELFILTGLYINGYLNHNLLIIMLLVFIIVITR